MKVLFIGGTGNISSAVSRLAVDRGIDLYLLNRGNRKIDICGAKKITCDINKKDQAAKLLSQHDWDVVVNWIAFDREDVSRDYELFKDKTKQYIFISSASAYQKPPTHPFVTESTPLANPYWQYSRNKIVCEDFLNQMYREHGFPVTIVRPSLTYDTVIPVPMGGWDEYTIVDRIKKGKKIIVHGDGTSLWTTTHSRDFAKGFVGLLGHQQAAGHAFHITSDEVLTWNQVYEALASAVGIKPKIVHIPSDFICRIDEESTGSLLGDKSHSAIFDNSKIKKFVPEFSATIRLKEGLKETIEWFEADPARMIIKQKTNAVIDKILDEYEKAFPGV